MRVSAGPWPYSKEEVTGHGFRATASSLLNESRKWHPDAIERQLAHMESDDVRWAYLRGEHWAERVRMMQFWSDYLDRVRDNGNRVVELRGTPPKPPRQTPPAPAKKARFEQPVCWTRGKSPGSGRKTR